MQNRISKHLVLMLAVLVATTGCIHKSGGQVTPWERVTTTNAVLAQSINTVAQGTIAVQQTGLITVAQAAPILTFTSSASRDQQALNVILAKQPNASNVKSIKDLVDDIGDLASNVVNSGAAGVKNPKSQQTISADIKAVVSSADLILTTYQQATGGTQ